MNWSQRMNLAIEYIENNLHCSLNIDDVARQAFCSKYHFHRMFFAHFNVTCAEYIRKRKLTLAAAELLNSNQSVLDIAIRYGYESPNAFTRAFRNMHGVNPGKVRSGKYSLSSYKRVFLSEHRKGGENMHYTIVDIPSFNIIGKSKQFEFETFVKNGPTFWKEYVGSTNYHTLYKLNAGRPGSVTQSPLLSAYFPTEHGKRDEFVDVLGIETIGEIEPKGFAVHTVPSATYAEFNCTYKTSMQTNRAIYGNWFSSTGFEREGSKPDIVSYFPIPFRPMSEMCVRWWVPVIKKP